MPLLLSLFLNFLEIGAVSFGGGYAMIPLLTEKVVANGWLTNEQMLNFIAVSESTPGPIAINMATFVGYSQGGFLGAFLATLGVVLPSFIIILLIATLIKGLMKFAGIKAFLSGLRPVVIGLIIATGINLFVSVIMGITAIGEAVVFDWKALVIFGFIGAIYFVYKFYKKKSISPIILILISAVLGILMYGVLGAV